MAVYKVPQNVEAEDKLLGPFSFKQFIFVIITVMALALAYALSQIILPLGLIPLPIAIFFGILAAPLRKDQPMEIYLAAIISFLLKPKRRLWEADGIASLVEVTAPNVEERQYGKGYNQEEVQRRLSYLATLVDSHGWSVRGVNEPDSSMQVDLYNEARAVDDVLDENNTTARQIDSLISQADIKRRQEAIERMHQPSVPTIVTQPTLVPQPEQAPIINAPPSVQPAPDPVLTINPYPNMRQSVLSPMSEQVAVSPPVISQPVASTPTPSISTVSPAIIDLAHTEGVSVQTLQREAKRLNDKAKADKEVVISLH